MLRAQSPGMVLPGSFSRSITGVEVRKVDQNAKDVRGGQKALGGSAWLTEASHARASVRRTFLVVSS